MRTPASDRYQCLSVAPHEAAHTTSAKKQQADRKRSENHGHGGGMQKFRGSGPASRNTRHCCPTTPQRPLMIPLLASIADTEGWFSRLSSHHASGALTEKRLKKRRWSPIMRLSSRIGIPVVSCTCSKISLLIARRRCQILLMTEGDIPTALARADRECVPRTRIRPSIKSSGVYWEWVFTASSSVKN